MRSLPAFLIAVLLLMSCSALRYEEPPSGPRARVRFVTDTKEIAVLRAYDDAGCSQNETEWMRLRNGPLITSTRKSLGMPLWKYNDNAAKEVYVEAGRQFNWLFVSADRTLQFSPIMLAGVIPYELHLCGVPFSYTFDETKDYEIALNWSRTTCRVVVSQVVVDLTGNPTLAEVASFSNQLTEANKTCLEQLTKKRPY
jgi:hypothetical protein